MTQGLVTLTVASLKVHKDATSVDIFEKIEDILKPHPHNLIVHAGTNDLKKNNNALRNVKIICKKIVLSNKKIVFSNIIYWKNKKNIDQQQSGFNTTTKSCTFHSQKNIVLIDNGNIKKMHTKV